MQFKYRVEILDECGVVSEAWDFKTKGDISSSYSIPLYIIDKIIKKTNDSSFTTKRKAHLVYRELMDSMKIHIIKPKLSS